MKKLTIGIPVFNGENTISETLDSVVQSFPFDVEILISDNDSTDNTASIVKSFSDKFSNIIYYKNEKNLGPDINFDLVVKKSSGDFVWLLGADDEIATGGIRAVLEVIENFKFIDAIFVNYSLHNRDTLECLVYKVLDIKSDVFCRNSDEFLNTVTVYPNFVSSIVVRKSKWLMYSSSDFFGTFWVQYAMLMKVVESGQSYCISTPYVMNRGKAYNGPNEANENGIAIQVLLNLIDIIKSLPQDAFSNNSILKACKEGHKYFFKKIFSSRRNGLILSKSLIIKLIAAFGTYPMFWLVELPLLFAPRVFHYWVWRFYKSDVISPFLKFFSRR
jgi:glycosyltransferase involved in cell wall biosynthesis